MAISRSGGILLCVVGLATQFFAVEAVLAGLFRQEPARAMLGVLMLLLGTVVMGAAGVALARAKDHHWALGLIALLPVLGVLLLLLLPDGEYEQSRPEGFEVIPVEFTTPIPSSSPPRRPI